MIRVYICKMSCGKLSGCYIRLDITSLIKRVKGDSKQIQSMAEMRCEFRYGQCSQLLIWNMNSDMVIQYISLH